MWKISFNIITTQPSPVSFINQSLSFLQSRWTPVGFQVHSRPQEYIGNAFLQILGEMVHELRKSLWHVLYLQNQIRPKMENCCHFWYRVPQISLSNLDVTSKASTKHLNLFNVTLIILLLKVAFLVILFTEDNCNLKKLLPC